MKVAYKLKLLLIFVVAGLILLTFILHFAINNETSSLLAEKLVETKEKEAPRLLELNAAYMNSYNSDYSIWDQTVQYVEGKKDTNWGDEELKAPLSNYKIDYIWVLDNQGKIIYSTTTNDKLVNGKLNISDDQFVNDLSVSKRKSFFIKHNNALTEIFAGGITSTNDKNRKLPLKGYLLLGRVVDTVYMNNLQALSTEIKFSLTNTQNAATTNTNSSTGNLIYSIPIKDFSNNTIAAFNVSRGYPVLSKYQLFLNKYLLAFFILMLIIGFAFYIISKRILLEPLYNFWQSLKENNANRLNKYLNQNDEFGSLSKLMTNFFIQNKELGLEIETRKKSELSLYNALEEKNIAENEKIKIEEFLVQQQSLLQLNTNSSELCFDDKLHEIIALASKSLNCERVGIWLYNNNISSITATHLYELSKNNFSSGEISYEKDYPIYFKHLKKDAFIIANNAATNIATKEFAADYLIPNGITSILDVPIRSDNKVMGVVCYEHVGVPREWSISEQIFTRSLADIIALNFEREERRKAEVLLTNNQIRFEETQEMAQIGSWEFNFFTKDVVWSKEMYRIFDLENTLPEKLFDAYRNKIYKADLPIFDAAVTKLLTDQETYSVESRIECSNGEIKYILAIGETLKSIKQGKIIGLRGTVQDITKQKQAALAKSDFLSCMSHEIRTPINGVIGIANLLQTEELNERQQEYVKTLNFSAHHLSTVVSDILDFSKIESGHMTFEKVSFNLEKNCRHIFELFTNQAAEKNIDFKFIPTPVKEFSLYGDYVRLNQVLSNLISNAIKFTAQGSVIFSYVAVEDSTDKLAVTFSVKDSGIGISEKNQKQIFESFKQANDTITRQYGGTGLGLTISKKLVELQDGKIYVKSEIDKGSEFIVELTFDKHVYEEKMIHALTTAEKNQARDLTGMKILVAEDNKVNAMVLTRFLSKWNIESKVAKDGQEAIDILNNEHFDLVLMDIQMPVLDGIEATKLIRELNNTAVKDIPIVAFTADASVDTHKQLLQIGFNHCMTKPFNPDLLFSFLQKKHHSILKLLV